MKQWKKQLSAALCAALLLGCVSMPALAEENEEYDLSDIPGVIIEDPRIDPLEWNFALSLSDLDPELIKLANKECLLSSTYEPSSKTKMKLRAAPGAGTMYLQSECAEALAELFAGAEEAGYKLYLKSAYRAYKTQKTMYNNRLERNNGKDDGWVSKPGASDHQTGLGCDVVPGSWKDKSMNSNMASTPECQWMAEHCYEYGFVIRYPEDKQDITEINYEPWHLRYVGKEVARYIWRNGLCLEEFHEQLQAAIDAYLAAVLCWPVLHPHQRRHAVHGHLRAENTGEEAGVGVCAQRAGHGDPRHRQLVECRRRRDEAGCDRRGGDAWQAQHEPGFVAAERLDVRCADVSGGHRLQEGEGQPARDCGGAVRDCGLHRLRL